MVTFWSALDALGLDWNDVEEMRSNFLYVIRRLNEDLLLRWNR